jgi:hypothetical protein
MQSADGEGMRRTVRSATVDMRLPEGVFWIADEEPLNMM